VLPGARQIEVPMKVAQCGQPCAKAAGTVVAPFQGDEVLLGRLPRRVPVMHDVADRAVDRIRPALREEHMVKPFGRGGGEFAGKPDRRLAGEMEVAGGVRQFAHLLGRRFDDRILPVTDIDAPQPGKGIEQPVAVGIGQPHALSGFEHDCAMLLVPPERRDRMDQVIAVDIDQRTVGKGRCRGGHRRLVHWGTMKRAYAASKSGIGRKRWVRGALLALKAQGAAFYAAPFPVLSPVLQRWPCRIPRCQPRP